MTKPWSTDLIPVNQFSRPGRLRKKTTKIVWHYTANPGATALNHVGYFGVTLAKQNPYDDKKDIYASAHLFIDRYETIEIIPIDEEAYHASEANPYSVGIELCIEKDGRFHPNTIKQAVAVGVFLTRYYNLTIGDHIRHYDVTGKLCPLLWVKHPQLFTEFKQEITTIIKGGRKLELKNQWQWSMLGDALTRLSEEQLLDYSWAEKAYTMELTVDELSWLHMVIFARSRGHKI